MSCLHGGEKVYVDDQFVGYLTDMNVEVEAEPVYTFGDPTIPVGTVIADHRAYLTAQVPHGTKLGRPEWDDYFLGIAKAVSRRADCSRRKVGAVVVDRSNRIVSTGYNGSEPGGPSCLAGECPRAASDVEPGSSYDTGEGACIAVHAEMNALLYAGRDGTKGSTLYITDEPCEGCRKPIKASGLKWVVWPDNRVKVHHL